MKLDPARCQVTVSTETHWPHQCYRAVWRDGHCRQHHPETIAARNAKSRAEERERRDKEDAARRRVRVNLVCMELREKGRADLAEAVAAALDVVEQAPEWTGKEGR